MSKMQVNCPYCNSALAAESEWAGQMLECPDCHQRFVCPYPGSTVPPPPGAGGFVPPPPMGGFPPPGSRYNPYNSYNPYGSSNIPQQRATMFTAFQKYADFSGRAGRREYWLFAIFNQLVSFAIGFFGVILLGDSEKSLIIIVGLALLYGLFTVIPGIAVTVRRCHDTGRSGWWIFIALLPLIGPLWLLCLLALPSDTCDNQYGPDPNGTYPDEAWPVAVGIVLMILSVLW